LQVTVSGGVPLRQIIIEVADDQKAGLLAELLSSLDFVCALQVHDANGEVQEAEGAVSPFYQDPRQPLLQKEEEAFVKMHEELVSKHLGEYVAIHQGQVIDCDPDEVRLVDRIQMNYPDEIVLIRQVQLGLPPPLYFRSPRLGQRSE
jgi:hypothetical protein